VTYCNFYNQRSQMNGFRIINTNCPVVIIQHESNFSDSLLDLIYSEITTFTIKGLAHLILIRRCTLNSLVVKELTAYFFYLFLSRPKMETIYTTRLCVIICLSEKCCDLHITSTIGRLRMNRFRMIKTNCPVVNYTACVELFG